MKNWIICTLLSAGLFISATAQEYTHALGIRLGASSGIDYNLFVTDKLAFNGLLTSRYGGMMLVTMLTAYRPVLTGKTDQLYFFGGGGIHVGYMRGSHYSPFFNDFYPHEIYDITGPAFGLEAIVGLEYRLKKWPVTLGINYKPSYDVLQPQYYWLGTDDFGLTARYIFN